MTDPARAPGGLSPERPQVSQPARQVTLLQRKKGKPGAGLGEPPAGLPATLKMKPIGNDHRRELGYITDEGLLVTYGDKHEDATWIGYDTVVLCAGQVPQRELADALQALGKTAHLIGGAFEAGELDAKRAIDRGRAPSGAALGAGPGYH